MKKQQTKENVYSDITTAALNIDKLSGDAEKIKEAKGSCGDIMLTCFKTLLVNFDTVPVHAWEDICQNEGWAHERIDPLTFETTRIDGSKPNATVKTFNSLIRKYFNEFKNLDVANMTELRKAIKKQTTPVEKIVKASKKLTNDEKQAIIEAIYLQIKGKTKLHKKAA